jgi:hypothetical protein
MHAMTSSMYVAPDQRSISVKVSVNLVGTIPFRDLFFLVVIFAAVLPLYVYPRSIGDSGLSIRTGLILVRASDGVIGVRLAREQENQF